MQATKEATPAGEAGAAAVPKDADQGGTTPRAIIENARQVPPAPAVPRVPLRSLRADQVAKIRTLVQQRGARWTAAWAAATYDVDPAEVLALGGAT